jgi:hypothetical protein
VEGILSTNFLRALIATCAIAFAACTPPAFAQINHAEVAVRRAISRQIPIGATVKLKLRDGRRFKAVLFGVADDGVVVKPATRIPVSALRVAYDDLDSIEREEGRLNFGRYAGIGAAIGGGALLVLLLALGG